jgi:hypothetical protein
MIGQVRADGACYRSLYCARYQRQCGDDETLSLGRSVASSDTISAARRSIRCMHRKSNASAKARCENASNYGPDSNSMIFASLFLENQRHAVHAQHKRPCIGPSVGPALPRAARAPGARQSGCVTSSTPYSLRRPFRSRTLRRYDRKRRRSFPRPLAKFGYHLSAAWQKMLRPGGGGV